jgi:hypothetical protein
LWRIRIDTEAGRLALEVRDGDLLLASFYTLDCHTNTLSPLTAPVPNTWWTGLEEAQSGQVYLHGYGDRKLGQHKGIWALAAGGEGAVWHQPELAFYGLAPKGLLAYEAAAQERGLSLLDTQTGQVLQRDISQEQGAEQVQAYSRTRDAAVIYPMLYREGETYFEQVREFLVQQLDCQPVSAIEYAETDNYLVVSYYLPAEKNKLDNFLAVFDLNGFLHLNEPLAVATDGVGSDTFFIFMRSLYYVRTKTTLKAYSL